MNRRKVLMTLGVAGGTTAALGTGAFSTATAEREMTVTVTDDANSFLSLTAGDEHGEFADTSGSQAKLDFSDGDQGLGTGSTYSFDDTLNVRNQGTQPVYVWTSVESDTFSQGDVYLYRAADGNNSAFTPARATQVNTGSGLSLGVYIDTTGIDTGTYDVDITIRASDEPPDAAEAPGGEEPEEPEEPTEFVDTLFFDSTASLLGTDGPGTLGDEQVVVTAEPSATSTDADGNGDATEYPSTDELPLMALDGNVFAAGVPFVQNDTPFGPHGNDEFFLNLLDEYVGSGTILWDESHGQFYDLDAHTAVEEYAESNGYTVTASGDLQADLSDADAVVVTSPSEAFSDAELAALSTFAAEDGFVILLDQSDYNNFDATGNLNAIPEALETQIRFNDNQVTDGGFAFETTQFNTETYASLFAERPGIGIDIEKGETYEVDVVSVADGDTVDVRFPDGDEGTVRILGIDTPETGDTTERIEEYEGITDGDALRTKANEASSYAQDRLGDTTVTLSFDDNEPLRGNFGRILGYLELPNGDLYNEEVIADGWARLYSSGFGGHDEFWDVEDAAQRDGNGIWELSDPATVPESRDRPVSDLFFPTPVAVSGGTTVVSSENDEPLVALDETAGVAAIGGPLIDEGFEPDEAGDGEPTNDGYQVYPFVTNVLDRLADGGLSTRVLVDGGHGQFNADFALGSEDMAYYQRYLEGQSTDDADSVALEQVNNLTDDAGPDLLDDDGSPAASALLISTPVDEFTAAEQTAVANFAAAGGAVALVGTAADTNALGNFDPIVAELGSSVGFTSAPVTDESNNLGEASLPTTTNFADVPELFTAFTPESGGGEPDTPSVAVTTVSGGDEYFVVENTDSQSVSLDGWSVSEGAGRTFTFTSVSLTPGETVVVTTNETPDSAAPSADYSFTWDVGNVWNNGGDTATLRNSDDTVVDVYRY